MMVFLLLYLHLHTIQGQDKLMLRGASNPCEGRVDIYHDGEWGLVGNMDWSERNSAVVCRSLGCGLAKKTDTGLMCDSQLTKRVWMNKVNCSGTEQNLLDCPSTKWDIIYSSPYAQVYIYCSGKPTLSLIMDGQPGYAGFVRLSTSTQNYYLCADKWDLQDAQRVCTELAYGKATKHKGPKNIFKEEFDSKLRYTCLKDEAFVWQCVNLSQEEENCKMPVSVTCSKHFEFRLKGDARVNLCSGNLQMFKDNNWQNVSKEQYDRILQEDQKWTPDVLCAQMGCGHNETLQNGRNPNVSLNCSGQVSISLNTESEKCYGVIYLNEKLNSMRTAVCNNNENELKKLGQVVCPELGCGKFMFAERDIAVPQVMGTSMACGRNAESLWHCQKESESCKGRAIICSESIKVRLHDGLDKCSGIVEIYYKDAWLPVIQDTWEEKHSNIVCSHLACGKHHKHTSIDTQQRTKLSLDQCSPTDSIHQCLKESTSSKSKFIEVICGDSQIFFVKGSSSCSGEVFVEQAGKTYTVSGMEDTWNNIAAEYACQRMQCGNLTSKQKQHRDNLDSEWMQLNCTSDGQCKLSPASANLTEAAEVHCSGRKRVTLTNDNRSVEESKQKCWGKVEVWLGDGSKEPKGICRDTWSKKHSEILCESLGCGKPVQYEVKSSDPMNVVSIHCPESVSDLSHCSFAPTSRCQEKPVHVTCSGSLKSRLSDPRDRCAGKVEAFLSGAWLPICGSLDENIQNTICTEIDCGNALPQSTEDKSSPNNGQGLVAKCDKDSKSIANCTVEQSFQACQINRIKCSGWSRLLVMEQKSACKGRVFVATANSLYAFRPAGLRDREGLKMLCNNLDCGELINHSSVNVPSLDNWWNRTYDCASEEKNILKCNEKYLPQGTTLVEKQQLSVICEESRTIKLKQGCYGQVVINDREKVCYSGWTDFMSETLCSNLDCGNFFSHTHSSASASLHHLSCTERKSEMNLLQCTSHQGSCPESVNVTCSGSLEFRLTENCGGDVQVSVGGEWKSACLRKGKAANLLCNDLGCKNFNTSKNNYGKAPANRANAQVFLSCEKGLKYCEKELSCESDDLVEIYCDDFKDKFKPPELPVSIIVGASVGLLLLVISTALVLSQRRRITNLLCGSRSFSQARSNLSSDDFEDVQLRATEENNLQLQNQAGKWEKEPSDSQASSEYDDIDEEGITSQNHRVVNEVLGPGVDTEEDPPLPDRGELDNDYDDDMEGYDDVEDSALSEDGDRQGVPAQPRERELPVVMGEEDYVHPDSAE